MKTYLSNCSHSKYAMIHGVNNITFSGRIEASNVIACEWCTVKKLSALFLQTTPEICLHLQVQLDMFEDDSSVQCDCQSRSESQM